MRRQEATVTELSHGALDAHVRPAPQLSPEVPRMGAAKVGGAPACLVKGTYPARTSVLEGICS